MPDAENDSLKFFEWELICRKAVEWVAKNFNVNLRVSNFILSELKQYTNRSLMLFELPRPNVAKCAGVFTFWFRKLKPISYADETDFYFPAINELVALMTGLAICQKYKDDLSNPEFSVKNIPQRLLVDWARSLRTHSYSPSSLTMAFELIASKY